MFRAPKSVGCPSKLLRTASVKNSSIAFERCAVIPWAVAAAAEAGVNAKFETFVPKAEFTVPGSLTVARPRTVLTSDPGQALNPPVHELTTSLFTVAASAETLKVVPSAL